MNTRRWEPYARTAVAAVALVAVNALVDVGSLRVRSAIVVATLVFAAEFHRAAKALGSRGLGRLLAYIGGSFALIVACVAVGEGTSAFVLAGPVIRLLLAWAFILSLLPPVYEGQGIRFLPSVDLGLLTLGAAAIWLIVARATGGIRPYNIDEVLYLFQSRHMWPPPFMQRLDPRWARFFLLPQTYARDGYLNGQYPPGWPFALALLPGAIGHWVLLVGIHLALIIVTYVLGRMLVSKTAGLLAAALVSVNGFELYFSMSFFSEVFTTTLLMAAMVSLLAGFRARQGRKQASLWIAAGLAAGWAGAARPLTGLALWAAIVLFVVMLERPSRRHLALAGMAMLAGVALPIGCLLWYNRITTGSPVQFGYALAERGVQALGFGTRGFVRLERNGLPYLDVVRFGVAGATANTLKELEQVFVRFWPDYLVLPLIFLTRHLGARIRWRLVAPFALLPIAYFFYFYESLRFLFELLPLAMIGTAWLVSRIWHRRPAAAAAAVGVIFASAIAATRPWLAQRGKAAAVYGPALGAIAREHGEHARVLVFVRDRSPSPTKPFFTAIYAYDLATGFHGPVVVARDLGESDTTLIARYPGYAPFRLVVGARASERESAQPHRAYHLIPFSDSAAADQPVGAGPHGPL